MFDLPFIIFVILLFLILIFMWRGGRENVAFIGGAQKLIRDVKNLALAPRSKSEDRAVKILEKITGKPFPTCLPKWLVWRGKRLELDGYNDKLKIALEFSGPLHTKWFPNKESYERYYNRLVNDEVKKVLCEKNNVYLILLDMSLPARHWKNYILSRLFDKFPSTYNIDSSSYINAQPFAPFRQPFLEKEKGLTELDNIAKQKII